MQRPEPDSKVGRTYSKGGPHKKFFSPNKAVGIEMGKIGEAPPQKQRRQMETGDISGYKKFGGGNKPK